MHRFYVVLGRVTVLLLLFVSACAPRSEPVIREGPSLPETPEAIAAPTLAAEAGETGSAADPQFADFDPNNFDTPTVIDNPLSPMQPGTFWAYEGKAVDGDQKVSRRIEFTVSDLTKEILGIKTVVAWILDYTDGELIEKEIAFYAQDNDGNVWYFGEHPEDFENGEFADAPTWIAGVDGAKPGIKMLANPQLGTPAIYQGWGPAVEWSDYGQIDQVGQKTCTPVDCYEGVLVIAESSLGEEGGYQLKYYAPNVGNVQVGWRGSDETQEELKLVEFQQLSPADLAKTHHYVLELDKFAYQVSKDVYSQTPPVQ